MKYHQLKLTFDPRHVFFTVIFPNKLGIRRRTEVTAISSSSILPLYETTTVMSLLLQKLTKESIFLSTSCWLFLLTDCTLLLIEFVGLVCNETKSQEPEFLPHCLIGLFDNLIHSLTELTRGRIRFHGPLR